MHLFKPENNKMTMKNSIQCTRGIKLELLPLPDINPCLNLVTKKKKNTFPVTKHHSFISLNYVKGKHFNTLFKHLMTCDKKKRKRYSRLLST